MDIREIVSPETYSWYIEKRSNTIFGNDNERMLYYYMLGLDTNNQSYADISAELVGKNGNNLFDCVIPLRNKVSPHIIIDTFKMFKEYRRREKVSRIKADYCVFANGVFLFDSYNFHAPCKSIQGFTAADLRTIVENRSATIAFIKNSMECCTEQSALNEINNQSNFTILQIYCGIVERVFVSMPFYTYSYKPKYPFKFKPQKAVSVGVEINLTIKEVDGIMSSTIALESDN